MIKAWEHFKTITHHKRLVMEGCFKVGLYRQGILHDMSKFSPSEFLVGARYWQGNRSPNNAERRQSAILLPGCTTRAGTSTIMNTGSITAATASKAVWRRRPCRDGISWRCSWTGSPPARSIIRMPIPVRIRFCTTSRHRHRRHCIRRRRRCWNFFCTCWLTGAKRRPSAISEQGF